MERILIQGKSLVLGAVIGLVIGLIIPIKLLDLLLQPPGSSYTSVTVVEGHTATVKFGDYEYSFSYIPSVTTFTLLTEAYAAKMYDATEGAVYNAYGIEIIVSEVHSDHIILLVKPTYLE